MSSIKLISLFVVLAVTLVAGFYPFFRKMQTKSGSQFPIGEAIACGVFLGAGLMHMLGDSAQGFNDLHYDYPWPFLIAGVVFLLFLLLDHIGREMYQHGRGDSNTFAILATVMLSVHSFFVGAALGLSTSTSVQIIILLAILAHKWAASFALAVQINKSRLTISVGILLFIIFSTMVPLGIIFGSLATVMTKTSPLIEPIFSSIAAGTFLYLGTLHGLETSVMVKQCCELKKYYFVIVGFAIMAVVAIWT